MNTRSKRKIRPPSAARTTRVKCGWCNDIMWGKNIVRHCNETERHDYLAWSICGQRSVFIPGFKPVPKLRAKF